MFENPVTESQNKTKKTPSVLSKFMLLVEGCIHRQPACGPRLVGPTSTLLSKGTDWLFSGSVLIHVLRKYKNASLGLERWRGG